MFLILTKIFSKSAKSFQEDWNMCMKWFTNRFSILESHSCHRHHSHTHHHYHICYHIHIKNVSEIGQSSIESKCCSTIPVQRWKLAVANCMTHFPSQPLFLFINDILSDILLRFVIFALSACCSVLLRDACARVQAVFCV